MPRLSSVVLPEIILPRSIIMKFYELTYLVPADLSPEEINAFGQKLNSFIQEENGILDKTKIPLKRKLGYPIKKKKEAYLITTDFYFKPEKLRVLEKKIKSGGSILRYLILTKETPKIPTKPLKRPRIKPKPKVELKEIEKRLEEILGQ